MNENIYLMHPVKNIIDVTKIYTIHYFEHDAHFEYDGESHDFWEINYIDKGDAIVTYDENEFLLKQSEIMFLQPNYYHNIRSDGRKPFNLFIISFEAKSTMLDYLGGKVFTVTPQIKELIHSITRESDMAFAMPMENLEVQQLKVREDAVLGSEQIIKMRVEEIVIRLLRQQEQNKDISVFVSKSKFDDHIAQEIQNILKENIYGNITLTDIMNRLGYGKTYLSNLFKRVYETSIMAYYMNLKVDEAKYLIRDNTMTIAEISEKLGFSSPQYFSRRFSQITKMSPREYANSVKEGWQTGTG